MEGVEYYTNINPTNVISTKVVQNKYNMEYKVAEHIFYNELYISKDIINKHLKNNPSYDITVIFSPEYDEIKTNTEYGVKFLKSIFLFEKQREVVKAIKEYYSEYIVTGPFFQIELDTKKAVFIVSKRV